MTGPYDSRSELDCAFLNELQSFVGRLSASVFAGFSSGCVEASRYEIKEDGSFVTEVDKRIELLLRAEIRQAFPDHAVMGEEYGMGGKDSPFRWLLDPVDGTDDLVRKLPNYGYIVALMFNDLPVAAAIGHPVHNLRFEAVYRRGTVMNGDLLSEKNVVDRPTAIAMPAYEDLIAAGIEIDAFLALCAAYPNYRVFRNVYAHSAVLFGALDACIEFDVFDWDIAATQLMVQEAGDDYVELGRRIDEKNRTRISAVFGKAEIVSQITSILDSANAIDIAS